MNDRPVNEIAHCVYHVRVFFLFCIPINVGGMQKVTPLRDVISCTRGCGEGYSMDGLSACTRARACVHACGEDYSVGGLFCIPNPNTMPKQGMKRETLSD